VLVTDGPYTKTKEHMGGFWILEAADMDEALAWARKGAISCDAGAELRELLFFPAPERGSDTSYSFRHCATDCKVSDVSSAPVGRPCCNADEAGPLSIDGGGSRGVRSTMEE
jgi:hypothetical protein